MSGPGCDHDAKDGRIFCVTCGKLKDRAALQSIDFKTFTGRASLKDSIQRSYETGEPPG